MDFHIDIPLIGYIFLKPQKCRVCGVNLGKFVSDLNIFDKMMFCNEHMTDFIAEREGWLEYRQNFKKTVEKYKNLK